MICPRLRPEFGSKLTMISDIFTPSACSSSSARPVRRPKATTPATFRNRCSTMAAMRLEVASESPGGSTTSICTVPSLNGGRKSRPNWVTAPQLTITAVATVASTHHRRRRLKSHGKGQQPFQPPQQKTVAPPAA